MFAVEPPSSESDETTVSQNQLCFRDPFRRLRLQIGGANIAARIAPVNSPTRRRSQTIKRVCSLLLSTARGAIRVRSWIE